MRFLEKEASDKTIERAYKLATDIYEAAQRKGVNSTVFMLAVFILSKMAKERDPDWWNYVEAEWSDDDGFSETETTDVRSENVSAASEGADV